jgi:hypothetical protein
MNKAKSNTVRCLTAGVATMTAVTIAFAPSVAPPTPHPLAAQVQTVRVVSPPVELTATVQPLSGPLPTLLTDWLETIVVPPSAGAPIPTPQFPPVVVGNGIDSTIKNVYNAVEPWVQWGFELAAYAVGWIPYVGWLSPQIMYFYNLGERIVQSITFNVADWLGGQQTFWTGLRRVARDTVNSFIYFANDQIHFWLPSLPPLPPLPPIGPNLASITTEKVVPGLLPGANAPDTQAPELPDPQAPEQPTIHRPFRVEELAKLVGRFTHRDTPGGTTSVDVQTLGEGQSTPEDVAQDQAPTRPHSPGLVGAVSSAVRDLVSSAPHPLRDRIVAAKPKKDNGLNEDNGGATADTP